MSNIKNSLKKAIGFDKLWNQINQKVDSQKILSAKLLVAENNRLETINSLSDVEFSVFSQVGDDGIIQWLINKIAFPADSKTFIEFGVENYTEATTRFLLINNNWSGLVMDGSEKNVQYIKSDSISWMYQLTAKQVFVTTENINREINQAGFQGEIGILHIDIDGNDYWIWNTITVVNPVLVIVEYNSAFGNDRPITIPYDPAFIAGEAHYSRLYYGTSLKALQYLAQQKGYIFLGCNSSGNNSYFIRNDYAAGIENRIKNKEFVKSKIRQNRLPGGELSLQSDSDTIKTFTDLTVYNVSTSRTEIL